MFTYTQKNLAAGSLIVLSIILYELVLDLMDECYEFGHILFEAFELGIETLISSAFQLSYHHAQIATFYCLIAIAFLAFIFLWFKLPAMCRRLSRNLKANWLRQKRRTSYFWRSMSLLKKVKCVTLSVLGATSMVFLI